MSNTEGKELYGIIAEFDDAGRLLEAAGKAHREGYARIDAYSPFAIEGLAEAMGLRQSRIPIVFLLMGLLGALGGFLLLYYVTVIFYPINVAGRPLNSWPLYIPITFEMAVLSAGVSGFLALLYLSRLPMPYHPLFNNSSFAEHASHDRFYLAIQADDPKFDLEKTREFITQLDPIEVSEIEK